MKKSWLKQIIFECYLEYLRRGTDFQLLKEDQDKEDNMIYGEGAMLPDATDQMLARFPTLKHCLIRLQTENFKDFVASIDYISPKPTEFRINLTNGQSFELKWMGKDFEATISGKRYYLGELIDFQQALEKLSILYKEGPISSGEEGSEEGPRDEREPAGGGGGNFPGEPASGEMPEEEPEGGEEENAEAPESEAGDMEDEPIDFEADDSFA